MPGTKWLVQGKQHIVQETATYEVAERIGDVMDNNARILEENLGTFNHLTEEGQIEVEAAADLESTSCRDTSTNLGGENTLNAKKQEFLETVLDIMEGARCNLPQFPGMRDEIEYWNEIVEAWQELTGKYLVQGDLEEEEWEKGWR